MENEQKCECGHVATWCHRDDMNADGSPMDRMGMCDDGRDVLLKDGVPAEELVSLRGRHS